MNKVKKLKSIPEISLLSSSKADYFDCYYVNASKNDTIDAFTISIFSLKSWTKKLMRFRNSLVRVFGLKTGNKKENTNKSYFSIGDKAVLFTVIDRNENEIVMGESDKHLNFNVSVLQEQDGENSKVYMITTVIFNNVWGRFYFLFVKPFHKIIIKSLLKNI